MTNYSIRRAVAISCFDIMVNGISIARLTSKKAAVKEADRLAVKGLLQHSKQQKIALGYTNV